ncbi:MAG: RluA family pseudouridine synthase [Solirubrobacterales bacterium]
MPKQIELVVTADEAGERLDQFLAAEETVGSRAQAAKAIDRGQVLVDGRPAKKSDRVEAGQVVVLAADETTVDSSQPSVAFSIVHEDDDLLVVDKPAGLVVHPAPGNRSGTLSQALAGRAGGGDPARPGIVHRLDKETSGLLVVAKNDKTLRALQEALARREVRRQYTALVRGRSGSQGGTVDAPLGRDRRNPENIAIRDDSSREAITHFQVVEELGSRSLLHVRLETGRTHQIRVHLAAINMPVCGDPQYGAKGDLGLERQFLHASELSFHHPTSEDLMVFGSPLPADLSAALEAARTDHAR